MHKIALLFFLTITTTFACYEKTGQETFPGGPTSDKVYSLLPENDLFMPPNYVLQGGISEQDFKELTDLAHKIYIPIIQRKIQKIFIMNADWEDGTVNAFASQAANYAVVKMFGGLARHHTINREAFIMVICHEIGHHIGGDPRKGDSWATNEGQADYYAASKCFKTVIDHLDLHPEEKLVGDSMDQVTKDDWLFAHDECRKSYDTTANVFRCLKSSQGGKGLAHLFATFRSQDAPLFSTPSILEVDPTYHSHPFPQCRMDTYFQGALCNKDYKNEDDYCTRKEGFTLGARPRCWYKPPVDD
jgi:hypothetical protein